MEIQVIIIKYVYIGSLYNYSKYIFINKLKYH